MCVCECVWRVEAHYSGRPGREAEVEAVGADCLVRRARQAGGWGAGQGLQRKERPS